MNKKYGLLGHPLGHSFSKKFHNERFSRLGIDAEYVNYDLEDISKLPDILLNEPTLCGLNVTIPYKQQMIRFLDEMDSVAQRIGAVNTICIHRIPLDESLKRVSKIQGLWLKGYNTDIIGFRDSIMPLLRQAGILDEEGCCHDDTAALILGTGGASKAIKVALEDMGISFTFVSRTSSPERLTYEQLSRDVMAKNRVIINCTPIGTFPNINECPNIPYEYLTSSHVCYDLVYNPEVTLFLAKAKEKGAFTMSGGAMLEGQAIASYNYWTEED
ncbi:MAG: shikimate dehydrogenase [Bacteroidales bacterium]|nr:shikimate dehydrogenase [Bacteroidales bacterium]